MSSTHSSSGHPVPVASPPRAFDVIVYGGLLLAVLDILNATTFWYVYREVPPARILQSIAAGLLGKEAYTGGAATAALGAILHVAIACGMAAVYYVGCRRWPRLLSRWIIAGLLYGAVVYLVMNHIVVPLSRAGSGPSTLPWFLANFFGHLLLVGLPLAWVTHWSARRMRAA